MLVRNDTSKVIARTSGTLRWERHAANFLNMVARYSDRAFAGRKIPAAEAQAQPRSAGPASRQLLHRRGSTGCGRGRHRRWNAAGCRRCGPRHVDEVEEIQQIRLGRIAIGEVLLVIDEAIFHKPEDRRVIHRHMGNVMPPGKRRDHHVGEPEPELGRKPLSSTSQ